jgi:hypothetical protein
LIGLVVLTVIIISIAAYYSQQQSGSSQEGPVIPFLAECGSPLAHGPFPINQTEAKTFAQNLIYDYDSLVQSKQANYPNWPEIEHFFSLYSAKGSFDVFVARDNVSGTDDTVEFLFAESSAASSQVTVYTNITATELRPITLACPNNITNVSYDWYSTPYGTIISHLTTNSPLNIAYFPLVWITNMTSVFNDPFAAHNAAQAIYNNDAQLYNASVNPPFPSWGWLTNVLSSPLWQLVVAVSVVIGIVTGLLVFKPKVTKTRRKRTR